MFPQKRQAPPDETVPEGVVSNSTGRAYSTDRLGRYQSHPAADRTFAVTPSHEKLENGVRFAVEDVTAMKSDLQQPTLDASALRRARLQETKKYYSSKEQSRYGYRVDYTPMRLEAESSSPENLVYAGSDGFLHAALTAFARHLPLGLTPDHVWSLIAYGFAKHVDAHAEELRSNFVQHEGKRRLLVSVDHFVMSNGVQGAGTPAELWERDVFPDFSRQIREHIGDKVHSAIAGNFSTTDSTSQAAHEIVLMSAMKNYFSYGMRTCCGIPTISLYGAREDWVSLRARAEHLGSLMLPEFADRWLRHLLPVLDEFISSYDGAVNHGFWQSMVKLRTTGGGSGSYSFLSGWIQILYPYRASGADGTHSMHPWNEMYFSGPEASDFPSISSAAPVDWEYYGAKHDLHFHAGFIGMTQNSDSGELIPAIGWSVTHDPPQDPAARLLQLQAETEALIAGHAGEEEKGDWFDRVCTLRAEHRQLSAATEANKLQEKIGELQQTAWRCEPDKRKEIEEEVNLLQVQQSEAIKILESA